MVDLTCTSATHPVTASTLSPLASVHRDRATESARPEIVRSGELLQGARELWIEHGRDMYRLRVTSSGKLYLTK